MRRVSCAVLVGSFALGCATTPAPEHVSPPSSATSQRAGTPPATSQRKRPIDAPAPSPEKGPAGTLEPSSQKGDAAAPAPSPEQGTAAAPAPSGDMGDAITRRALDALSSQDFAAVEALFDARMKRAVPAARLGAVWDQVSRELGALVSSDMMERGEAPGQWRRVMRLVFERGSAQLLVSINPASQEVTGLAIRPLPSAPATAAASAPYVVPSAFQAQPVRFGAEPFVLSGVLTVPVSGTPAPAVVLLHGSGPADRDGTVGGVRPLKDLAEGLSSKGFVVLRYDKRTLTHGARMTGDIGLEEEVLADAVAAVALLKARPEVDPSRVFVVGHSLGALLAPEVAVRTSPVAGAVLLAPPGRKPWALVVDQLRHVGAPREQLAEVEAQAAKLEAGTLAPTERFLGVPAAYWMDVAGRDGVAMARKLKRPVLVLRGSRDYQVLDEDLAHWKRGLSGVKLATVETVPGGNHLFVSGQGPSTPAEYQQPGHVDAAVIERLVRFMGTAKPVR
jgi:dienelactone hydrolase